MVTGGGLGQARGFQVWIPGFRGMLPGVFSECSSSLRPVACGTCEGWGRLNPVYSPCCSKCAVETELQ